MANGSSGTDDSRSRAAVLVSDARRVGFLPRLFGRQHFLLGKMMVYHLMETLSPYDYRGGFWNFYEWDGEPLYLAPVSRPRYRIVCETNDYEGEVSAAAAGIIATLFTFSHLSFNYPTDLISERFHRLRDFAGDHLEAAEILQAID